MSSELSVNEIHDLTFSGLVFTVHFEFLEMLAVQPVEQGFDCGQNGFLG